MPTKPKRAQKKNKKKKPQQFKKRYPPHKRIPMDCGLFTALENRVYDLIYSYGLRGCWMSNATIAGMLHCSVRSVRRARRRLFERKVIIMARTIPHTWTMWARYHSAVKNCQVLLFPPDQKMENPYCETKHNSLGVAFSVLAEGKTLPLPLLEEDKMSSKSVIDFSPKVLKSRELPEKRKRPAAPSDLSRGTNPQTPVNCTGGTPATPASVQGKKKGLNPGKFGFAKMQIYKMSFNEKWDFLAVWGWSTREIFITVLAGIEGTLEHYERQGMTTQQALDFIGEFYDDNFSYMEFEESLGVSE